MNLYDFITPSDPITFYAPDDDVALAIAVYVGNGKAGCTNLTNNTAVDSMIFLDEDAKNKAKAAMQILADRLDECIEAAHTFAVCRPEERELYDDYTASSTDKEKIKKWDDKRRSSISDWCGYARGLKRKE